MQSKIRYWLFLISLAVTVPFWFAIACGEKSNEQTASSQSGEDGKTGRGTGAEAGTAPQEQPEAKELTGAGATFPFPLYTRWAETYGKSNGLKLNYQAIGSGGGVSQIRKKTVDFGASDEPMKPEELEKDGLFQFPMAVGGVVPVVNIAGIQDGQLRLTPETLCGIYLRKIRKWNDAELRKINEGVNLPDADIAVVYRSDGSGTTWMFTDYLSRVCPEWKDQVGAGKSVQWPVGMGGKGNPGVASYVKQTAGAIGYVEFAYALQNGLATVQMQNKNGKMVKPSIDSFMAAARNADWANAPGFYLVLNDQAGDDTWPIAGATFILIHRAQENGGKVRAMFRFFDWCYRQGAQLAKELHYVPMPENVTELVEKKWESEITCSGKPVAWK